jgi:hypothetical protein
LEKVAEGRMRPGTANALGQLCDDNLLRSHLIWLRFSFFAWCNGFNFCVVKGKKQDDYETATGYFFYYRTLWLYKRSSGDYR